MINNLCVLFKNKMLRITRNKIDNLDYSKEQIHILVENSLVSFLSESIDQDSNYEFDQILDRIKYVSDNIDYDWNVFTNFLNKKTVFHDTDIISNHDESISILVKHIEPRDIMWNLKCTIIPNNIPQIIKTMQLSGMYEQLIFYEYIYINCLNSYVSKAWIIVENDYYQLLSLLENAYLDICTTTDEESMYSEFMQILNYYFPDEIKHNLLHRYLKVHNNWLLFSDNPDFDLSSDMDLYPPHQLTNNSIEIYNVFNDFLFDQKRKPLTLNQITDKLDLTSKKIKLHELCHLNAFYINESNIPQINDFFNVIIEDIDFTGLLTQTTDQVSLYNSIDLFVRLMEIDLPALLRVNMSVKIKVLSLWLKMNSPDLLIKFYKQKLCPISPINIVENHNIVLSQSIKDALAQTRMTFAEMGYIFAFDRLDMFKILCEKLEFISIHQSIYKYLSPSIIEYVVNKHVESCNNLGIKRSQKKETISINPFNLIYRSSDDINNVFNTLNNHIEFTIEYESFVNMHHYDDCSYIAVYWNYLQLLQSTHLFETIFSLFRDFTSNAEIDCIILHTLIDNVSDESISPDLKKYFFDTIDQYLKPHYSNPMFFVTGPDFHEIQSELSRYCVNTNGLLNSLSFQSLNSNPEFKRTQCRRKTNNNSSNDDSSELIDEEQYHISDKDEDDNNEDDNNDNNDNDDNNDDDDNNGDNNGDDDDNDNDDDNYNNN